MRQAVAAAGTSAEVREERGMQAPPHLRERGCRRWTGVAAADDAFPPEPQVLQEGGGDLAQQGVVVQTAPAAALEVVEAELVLHLLVHLLAHPAGLDRGGQDPERRI